ncbi:chemotaxis protein CheW [Rhodanobacter lindaniclasticus]
MIVLGTVLKGSTVEALWNPAAFVIVFFGTLAALLVQNQGAVIKPTSPAPPPTNWSCPLPHRQPALRRAAGRGGTGGDPRRRHHPGTGRWPPYVLGVRHLRGRIVPVLDGERRMGVAGAPAYPADVRVVMLATPSTWSACAWARSANCCTATASRSNPRRRRPRQPPRRPDHRRAQRQGGFRGPA